MGEVAADTAATAAPSTAAQRVLACLRHIAHLLPAQAPLRDFVHHNTLHAFQHVPFIDALAAAARLTGARPWLPEERCRELFRQGRIDAGDLAAALRQLPAARADETLFVVGGRSWQRGEVLQVALRQPARTIPAATLRWQFAERAAGERLQADLEPTTRQRLLAAAGGDERALVADLWATACALRADPPATPAAQPASLLWQELHARLGDGWTLTGLLAHLSGEDAAEILQPMLIRHLAAHLDGGLAAWKNPLQMRGFYAAWRASAGSDWTWELDEFAGARQQIRELPDDALQAIVDELQRLGIESGRWCGYLQQLAMELPGWAGMFHWRQSRPRADAPPVDLGDLLAVRMVLDRLYGEQLLHRVWGLPMQLETLAAHLIEHPQELLLRHAHGNRSLPDEILASLRPLLLAPVAGNGRSWTQLALAAATAGASAGEDNAGMAWPLFVLAQHLGLDAGELRELGSAGTQALLACATSLSDEERGLAWLLAYEHHYRQRILAALAANRGRSPARVPRAAAQLVFCMDDREEGTRRHLEEVEPAYETFGAAGFFGVPMLWQGIDDETPTALCPVVVRPTNAVRETVPATARAAHRQHLRRRGLRLRWQERLHQRSRRGSLLAALLTAIAAPAALLALFARTLAAGRFGGLLERCRAAFDQPLPGTLQLTADGDEASRDASADSPRQGFSEDEQVARVAGFLRSIGLTEGFAPLLVIVGHGSDSRNNPHLSAYDCGACSGRHGGPNARVLAALANRPQVRRRLAEQGIVIAEDCRFVAAEHNTCDESFLWYEDEPLNAAQQAAFARLRRDCDEAARLHAVERCRRFASAPGNPTPQQALQHLADRRHDLAQARPELGHATVATAFIGRRSMSRGAFFDRRAFLISYDPLPDGDGRILEATLLAAAPVGAGINLEYYFSTVNNEGYGCGSKVMHNLAGLFGVMQGSSSDLRTGLPLQMVEIHEAMRLLVIVEQTREIIGAIYQRQPPLQELIGNGWVVLGALDPPSGAIDLFDPARGWQPWTADAAGLPPLPECERSGDWFAGHREPLSPALLRRPLARP
ncbi:DUF2309 domain-containing protein [Accumulibacter sp.]|uniref:DUF2309 domain-containing protein n=1 Tax=Accumulibacter sp. TaxID=2053492 RepID=UPI002600AD53|nr:DUF2309 domain-containing protein [Accumulibacter sp.]MCM8612937.1 DUF2309 domain-containing protein [Accumulibacter sp.]MCM8636604.1 DUF2309 domain-containing protein [Accumulibacter sp.]MCM8640311.1 DUF2309 domain-containing protein [Accumulibacter sp.]